MSVAGPKRPAARVGSARTLGPTKTTLCPARTLFTAAKSGSGGYWWAIERSHPGLSSLRTRVSRAKRGCRALPSRCEPGGGSDCCPPSRRRGSKCSLLATSCSGAGSLNWRRATPRSSRRARIGGPHRRQVARASCVFTRRRQEYGHAVPLFVQSVVTRLVAVAVGGLRLLRGAASVRPNPSLERRPHAAGHLGPATARGVIVCPLPAQGAPPRGAPQLER